MSRSANLEEFTRQELVEEIARRDKHTEQDKCWYCGRSFDTHSCRESQPIGFGHNVYSLRINAQDIRTIRANNKVAAMKYARDLYGEAATVELESEDQQSP